MFWSNEQTSFILKELSKEAETERHHKYQEAIVIFGHIKSRDKQETVVERKVMEDS